MAGVKEPVKVNPKFKDRLFRMIFGAEENKEYLVSLCNAVNEIYGDPSVPLCTSVDDIEITTLDDVIYIKQKNDVSFLFDSEMSLYEQQSSYNPNMPLRGLMYFSDLYHAYLSSQRKDLYGSRIVKIPTPKYVVFYNGDRKCDDRVELKLSDAFIHPDPSGRFQWTATMLNINAGHNNELLSKCTALLQYSEFVQDVRMYKKTMSLEAAVDMAVDNAIRQNFLNGFFKTHREGVISVCLTEYNEEEFIANRREEGRQEGLEEGLLMGREEGRQEGRREGRQEGRQEGIKEGELRTLIKSIKALMSTAKVDFDNACEMLTIAVEERSRLKSLL